MDKKERNFLRGIDNDTLNQIIEDIIQDTKELLTTVASGKKLRQMINDSKVKGRIREVTAKRLGLAPDDPELDKILEEEFDPDNPNNPKDDSSLNKKLGKNTKKATTFKTFLLGFQEMLVKEEIEKQTETEATTRVAGQDGTQSATQGATTSKTQTQTRTSGGGGSGRIYPVGEPSFRGLDSSRIAKMVKGMFGDIQTMGFSAAYLGYEWIDDMGELHQNSPGFADAIKREDENEKRKYEMEQMEKTRAEEREKVELAEEEENTIAKLTTQKKMPKTEKALVK